MTVAASPLFTSTPVTGAAEGLPYTYQLTVNGSAAIFSLTNGPHGATLSGSTLSWTPAPEQSRVPNSFTVTATASDGASATQSWTVTPAGTVRISWIDRLWNEQGSTTTKPFDWSPAGSLVAALVPQPDGSFKSLSGTAAANGEFDIPNVPGGYYWLKISPRSMYWTSSSTFDVGSDAFAPVTNPTVPGSSSTNISFSFTSLDPTAVSGLLQFDTPDVPLPRYLGSTNAGSTTFSGSLGIGSNLDFSLIKNGFARQYEPTVFGSVDGFVLGPELTLTNLSLTTGAFNTISGALNPVVPASMQLSVQGSAWASLFDRVSPTAPTALGGAFYLSVESYIASDSPNLSGATTMDLFWTKGSSVVGGSGFFSVLPSGCVPNPPLTTDVEAGAVRYNDPFPAIWRRTFRVCHAASVDFAVPGTSQMQTISVTNDQTTLPPTSTVKPLLSSVLNPKINGGDLFVASTVSSTGVILSWDPPAIGTPFGYQVAIMSPTASLNGATAIYLSSMVLGTAKNSMTLPPGVLRSGQTYLFVISALTDGRASMETSPHRSSLPTADAEVISAPIATN